MTFDPATRVWSPGTLSLFAIFINVAHSLPCQTIGPPFEAGQNKLTSCSKLKPIFQGYWLSNFQCGIAKGSSSSESPIIKQIIMVSTTSLVILSKNSISAIHHLKMCAEGLAA